MRNKKAKKLRRLNKDIKKPPVYIHKTRYGKLIETKVYRVPHFFTDQEGSKFIPITPSNSQYHQTPPRRLNF